MGLIKCPDCGQMISENAEVCIHCGCPMNSKENQENYTYIKVPSTVSDFKKGNLSSRTSTTIIDAATRKTIAIASEGEVVKMSTRGSTDLEIKVSCGLFSWHGTYTIVSGKRYQICMVKNIFGGWKPNATPILNEIDSIVAG